MNKTHNCKGKGCKMVIQIGWGDLCSTCFYEGMNPEEYRKYLEKKADRKNDQEPK